MTVQEFARRLEFRGRILEYVREQLARIPPGPYRDEVQRQLDGLTFQRNVQLERLASLEARASGHREGLDPGQAPSSAR